MIGPAHPIAVSSALRRFGILECIPCGEPHEFVSYDPAITHITDAFCAECGYIPGRKDDLELSLPPIIGDERARPMTRREHLKVPVISDAEAARALARLQARYPGAADAKVAEKLRSRSAAPADAVTANPPAPAGSLRSPSGAPGPDAASLRSPPSGPAASAGASLRSPPAEAPPGPVPVFDGPGPGGRHVDPLDELLDVEDDGSRRAAFLRSLGAQWPNLHRP